ncbi:CTLH/CRA C-terminal to lish motif domain-containing protein [Neurospora hispaniola]|uniref:CTLH/CRA C-terminal to lish motif domain-containing protein n=1 Tax=Neurospora hispaniola TaxID=588809 RepID=A0AAJ0IAR7_9PEZI|nr:CTLH/CRA C-terminal to lish motif domain-containing protein [Neurospora hispaniola]
MADHEASKINHDNHLLLDQPLLRLPYELLRKNFRSAHFTVEKESTTLNKLLKETAKGSLDGKTSPEDVVKNLDTMIAKMRGMKRKLSTYANEETRLYKQLDARVAHLRELSDMHSVEDVKYEAWSRKRLDRLLVDYMLRHGYNTSAQALANEREMHDLVDVETFLTMSKIRESLENGSVTEALAWCNDNKKELRKLQSNLEFLLRCQQYIELLRINTPSKSVEAITHAKKYIAPFQEQYPDEVREMAALLAHRPTDKNLPPKYAAWYSPDRWTKLATSFVEAHNKLLGLPTFPLLHTALSSGLSALKTPACHGTQKTTSSSQPGHSQTSMTSTVCPICSIELNELAKNVPYAHHSKSHLDNDLLLLPNGRVYGQAKLDEYAAKAGLAEGQVKDLVTGEVYSRTALKKVFA